MEDYKKNNIKRWYYRILNFEGLIISGKALFLLFGCFLIITNAITFILNNFSKISPAVLSFLPLIPLWISYYWARESGLIEELTKKNG